MKDSKFSFELSLKCSIALTHEQLERVFAGLPKVNLLPNTVINFKAEIPKSFLHE